MNKAHLVFALLALSVVNGSFASQVEFCEVEGKVLSLQSTKSDGLKIIILVTDARKYKSPIEGVDGDTCEHNVGKELTVLYSKEELAITGKIQEGDSHTSRYSILDFGSGSPIVWKPVKNS